MPACVDIWAAASKTKKKCGPTWNNERHGCLRGQSETFEETCHADTLILYSDLNNSENINFCSWHSPGLSGYRVRENLKISFFDFITIKNAEERDAAFGLPLFALSSRGTTQSSKIVKCSVCVHHANLLLSSFGFSALEGVLVIMTSCFCAKSEETE